MEEKQKIFFGTKEENNERRLQEALTRTPDERFRFFLQLCEEMQMFYNGRPHPNDAKNNWVLKWY